MFTMTNCAPMKKIRDKKDASILKILQSDSRFSMRKIAEKLDMKPTSVFNRIKKMEESLIEKYTVVLDRKALGYNVLAFVLVSYKYGHKDQENLAKEFAVYPQILDVSMLAGDWDIILKVVEKDVDSLGEFITNVLRKKESVEKTSTMIVLKEIKTSIDIPVE